MTCEIAACFLLLAGILVHLYQRKAWERSLIRIRENLETAHAEQDAAHERLKVAFTALSTKEELLDKITGAALDGIVMLDDRGLVAFANRAAARLLGYTDNEFLGLDLHAHIIPPKQRKKASLGYRKFARTGRGIVVGTTVSLDAVRKNGEPIPVELSISALDMNGRWHAIGVLRDMRGRKHMEQAREERTESFRALVQENRAGILILDKTGSIRFANSAATRQFSVSAEELKRVLIDTPSAAGSQVEIGIMRHDGSRGTAAAVFTETVWKGESAYLVMLYDITERKTK